MFQSNKISTRKKQELLDSYVDSVMMDFDNEAEMNRLKDALKSKTPEKKARKQVTSYSKK